MRKMHIYSHTHWDYEWYFTANESIIQLVYHMDEVISALQKGVLQSYLLDSQVSILEEYLTFMPEHTDVVKALVKSGRLMIGPWYTQSDELIVSGECLARNLWYGMRYAKELGKCMNIGYLPDSFGQNKDMPKLYKGFGIEYALFWRGCPSDVCDRREFMWNSMDGSSVLTYNIRDGYFFGGNLIYTDDVNGIEERFLQQATKNNQLFPVGGDQRYVDFNLRDRIAYYTTHTTHDIHYVESDLETFFKELREEGDFITLEGEFIDASVSKIHHSIYSTRYDHKVLNDTIERRILYQIEPFMVMQQMMGIAPKISVLEKLWKKLLLNHAHDSACGCNSDKTNRSILQRLKDCDEMSSMMLDYQVRKTSESLEGIRENDLVFYNTLPYTRIFQQEIEISTKRKGFIILDETGKELVYDVLSTKEEYSGSIRKDTTMYADERYYYQHRIRIQTEIAPMSMCVCHIEEGEHVTNSVKPCVSDIENTYYRIMIKEDKLCLYDKQKEHMIEDFLYIQDSGDDGDTYDYSYPSHDVVYDLRFTQAEVVRNFGNIFQKMTIAGEFDLPYELKEREKSHVSVRVPYSLEILLDHSNVIQCAMHIHNRVVEHRMRVIIRSNVQTTTAIADTLFGTIERENAPKHMNDWKAIGYREEPSPIYPMLHHVSVKDQNSCTVYVKGIKEYEILNEGIALTLFRSVKYLGKPDLQRRPGIASGNEFRYIETPDAQLLQTLDFTFAVSYDETYDALQIQKRWLLYANDVLYYQIQEMNRFVNTQKYFVTHPYQKKLKRIPAFLSLDTMQECAFSSLIPLDETAFALRVFHTRWVPSATERILLHNVDKVVETNFMMEEIQSINLQDNIMKTGNLTPEEVKTYKITKK